MGAEMEPASATALNDLGWSYMLAGDLANAEHQYREAIRLDAANLAALMSLGYCLELRNSPGEAMKFYRRALQIRGAPDEVIAKYDRIYATSGLHGVYESWFEYFKTHGDMPRSALAFYAARAGRSAEAMELLRESARRREPGTIWLAVHPAFASLRNQREFGALVASSFHTR